MKVNTNLILHYSVNRDNVILEISVMKSWWFSLFPIYAHVPTQSTTIPLNWSFHEHPMKKKPHKVETPFPAPPPPPPQEWLESYLCHKQFSILKGVPSQVMISDSVLLPVWMSHMCCLRNTGSKKNTQVILHRKSRNCPERSSDSI